MERSVWPIVFALGGPLLAPTLQAGLPLPLLITEILRALLPLEIVAPLTLSFFSALDCEKVRLAACNFCWCRKSRSLRVKHFVHSADDFSLVWDRT